MARPLECAPVRFLCSREDAFHSFIFPCTVHPITMFDIQAICARDACRAKFAIPNAHNPLLLDQCLLHAVDHESHIEQSSKAGLHISALLIL